MISERLGTMVRQRLLVLGGALAKLGLTANMLTVIGVVLNLVVAVIIATGHPVIGGVLLLFASAFDMLDGAVARATGVSSPFGGFLDSTLDRYSETLVYIGVLIYMLDTPDWKMGAILTLIAACGALLISYARARAESAGYKASVGLLARPERVLILALGLMLGYPMVALWILAIGTHLTALTRIVHVWRTSEAAAKAEVTG